MYALAQMIPGRQGPGFIGVGHLNPWAMLVSQLLWLAVFAGVVTLIVLLVMRFASGNTVSAPAVKPDAAINELRLRYARGEVGRDDYMRMAADLGEEVPAPTTAPVAS